MSLSSEDYLSERLAAVIAPVMGEGVSVRHLERLPGGASRETWAFDAAGADGSSRRLVLRRDPPGAPGSGLGLEVALLEVARGCGVPVPALVVSGGAGSELSSSFMVVEFVEGETIPRRILREEHLAKARSVLALRCGEALAAIHRMDPTKVPGIPGGDPLDELRSMQDRMGEPHPAFELAFRWLGDNRPPRGTKTVVHGDFRNGNLVIGPDGIRAVLDWELAHVGDPLEDLGWLCVKAWRFGASLPVGGFGTVEQLVDGYVSAGGAQVDIDSLRWWEIFGTLRWGIICIVQVLTHLTGALRSVELAAIGRRVCEVEWDLLEMLP